MTFSLSTSRITATVHALAALEMLTATDSTRLLLSPLLDRERPEALAQLILDSFASTLLEILPYVESSCLDTASAAFPELPELLRLDLRIPSGQGSGASAVILRSLEQAVTSGVLESALLAGSPAGSAAADRFATRRAASLATLLTTLRTPAAPFIRNRGY